MSRLDLRTGCLCLAATAGLAWPALGADLPVSQTGTRFFITNEANPNKMLESSNPANPNGLAVKMVPPASLTVAQLGDTTVKTGMWEFQAIPGQPGRVAIIHLATGAILEGVFDPLAADTAAAGVQLTSPKPAIPALGQQWRIIATKLAADGVTPTGPFLIKNAQTGQLLDVATAAPNNARLFGRDDPVSAPSSRQWRFLSTKVQFTNSMVLGSTVDPLTNSPDQTKVTALFPAAAAAGNVNFGASDPTVTVTVKLNGDGTNELKANVQMTVKDSGGTILLDGTSSPDAVVHSLKMANPGRIIQLLDPSGLNGQQSCSYTDADDKQDVVTPPNPALSAPFDVGGKIGTLDPTKVTFTPGTPFDFASLDTAQLKPTSPPGTPAINFSQLSKAAAGVKGSPIIRCCVCVGRPPTGSVTAAGKTCVLVVLERMPFLSDVP